MLGNHADHFMLTQMRERVVASTPNAGGRSFMPPDRERAGSAHINMRAGLQMPGPQREVSSGYMPGMGNIAPSLTAPQPSGSLPGMGGVQPGGALPGMGDDVPPPPTVAVNLSTGTLIGWGIAAAALVYLLSRPAGKVEREPEAVKA